MPTVVITETIDQICLDWLAERAEVIPCAFDQTQQLNDHLPTASGLIVRTYTQVNDTLLDKAPRLKVVGRAGVGLENIDVAACHKRNITVVYTPESNSQAVVEYVFGLILDALRPRPTIDQPSDPQAFRRMRREQMGVQLDQLTLGIVGFGRIGKRLGAVADAIGMDLLVNDLLPEPAMRKAVPYPFDYVDKPKLYGRSDIITLHVDGRSENYHMVDVAAMNRFQSNVLFINAARGMLVDHAALADWARNHSEAKCVLDVHDPEPIPDDYPLFNVPNVRLLPHIGSRTYTAMENMSWVVRDVAAVLTGDQPQYPADAST